LGDSVADRVVVVVELSGGLRHIQVRVQQHGERAPELGSARGGFVQLTQDLLRDSLQQARSTSERSRNTPSSVNLPTAPTPLIARVTLVAVRAWSHPLKRSVGLSMGPEMPADQVPVTDRETTSDVASAAVVSGSVAAELSRPTIATTRPLMMAWGA
jgi:hypothetical protein